MLIISYDPESLHSIATAAAVLLKTRPKYLRSWKAEEEGWQLPLRRCGRLVLAPDTILAPLNVSNLPEKGVVDTTKMSCVEEWKTYSGEGAYPFGMPPVVEHMAATSSDDAPDAYEGIIECLRQRDSDPVIALATAYLDNNLTVTTLSASRKMGAILRDRKMEVVNRAVHAAHWIHLGDSADAVADCLKSEEGRNILPATNSHIYSAEITAALQKRYGTNIAATYYMDGRTGLFNFSIRSEAVDCNAIAAIFEGSGNKHSAVFSLLHIPIFTPNQ